MPDLFTQSDATISPCGAYRYWLERKWSGAAPQTFVMLNHSTADASIDDRTIGRCIEFSKREGALINVCDMDHDDRQMVFASNPEIYKAIWPDAPAPGWVLRFSRASR